MTGDIRTRIEERIELIRADGLIMRGIPMVGNQWLIHLAILHTLQKSNPGLTGTAYHNMFTGNGVTPIVDFKKVTEKSQKSV